MTEAMWTMAISVAVMSLVTGFCAAMALVEWRRSRKSAVVIDYELLESVDEKLSRFLLRPDDTAEHEPLSTVGDRGPFGHGWKVAETPEQFFAGGVDLTGATVTGLDAKTGEDFLIWGGIVNPSDDCSDCLQAGRCLEGDGCPVWTAPVVAPDVRNAEWQSVVQQIVQSAPYIPMDCAGVLTPAEAATDPDDFKGVLLANAEPMARASFRTLEEWEEYCQQVPTMTIEYGPDEQEPVQFGVPDSIPERVSEAEVRRLCGTVPVEWATGQFQWPTYTLAGDVKGDAVQIQQEVGTNDTPHYQVSQWTDEAPAMVTTATGPPYDELTVQINTKDWDMTETADGWHLRKRVKRPEGGCGGECERNDFQSHPQPKSPDEPEGQS